MDKKKYYIVEESVLPQGLLRAYRARQLLQQGKAKNISEAVRRVGISRSVYYRYKDKVQLYGRQYREDIITLRAVLRDRAGVLSMFLNGVAKAGANVLTVSQSIPVGGTASITMSLSTAGMKMSAETMVKRLLAIDGVEDAGILQE